MTRMTLLALIAGVLAFGITDAAAAAEARTPAVYGGETIDLADGDWHGARVCVVHDRDTIECFATEAHAAAAVDGYDPDHRQTTRDSQEESTSFDEDVAASGDSACYWDDTRFLYLYSDPGYAGTVLALNQTGQWDNLADFGFDNRTSSYANQTDCGGLLADGTGGANRTLTAHSAMSALGSWDNRISSVCLAVPPGGSC